MQKGTNIVIKAAVGLLLGIIALGGIGLILGTFVN